MGIPVSPAVPGYGAQRMTEEQRAAKELDQRRERLLQTADVVARAAMVQCVRTNVRVCFPEETIDTWRLGQWGVIGGGWVNDRWDQDENLNLIYTPGHYADTSIVATGQLLLQTNGNLVKTRHKSRRAEDLALDAPETIESEDMMLWASGTVAAKDLVQQAEEIAIYIRIDLAERWLTEFVAGHALRIG